MWLVAVVYLERSLLLWFQRFLAFGDVWLAVLMIELGAIVKSESSAQELRV